MRIQYIFVGLLAVLTLSACATMQEAPESQLLFEDSMSENWQAKWFLDGEKATLEHRDGGLAFITEESGFNKNENRAAFDAQHAVLWTRESFEGDIRISYKYTRLPGCTWQKLIYIQAQGVGGPFDDDIYAWKEGRKVSVMSEYFNHMDLIALSLRNEVRCKRYPWNDLEGNDLEDEFFPRAKHDSWPTGHELDVVVEKRKESVSLLITDTVTGKTLIDQTWDLTDPRVLNDHDPKFVTEGRIGIRQMGGHKLWMRDFKVERL